jgi:cell division protein FtsW
VSEWAIEARLLCWLTFLWLFVGLAVMFSASYPVAESKFGDGLYYFKRQLFSVLLGLVGFNILVNSRLRYPLAIADRLVTLLLGLIFLTLIPGLGTNTNGATRWLSLGPVPIQPSELIKPFGTTKCSHLRSVEPAKVGFRLKWLLIFALILLGILLQPNLSTTALCGITLWLVALAAGLPYLYLG